MEEEEARKFEAELNWCVEQMRIGLASGKLSEKQDKDYRGALKILENPKKPYPQKRQVMRNSFGDYREKMAKEEAKLSLDVKVAPVAPKKETLIFLKKKASSASKEKAPSSEFKFNFSNDN